MNLKLKYSLLFFLIFFNITNSMDKEKEGAKPEEQKNDKTVKEASSQTDPMPPQSPIMHRIDINQNNLDRLSAIFRDNSNQSSYNLNHSLEKISADSDKKRSGLLMSCLLCAYCYLECCVWPKIKQLMGKNS